LDTRVELIKAVAGMDGKFIRCCLENDIKAIVIEAMGRGNLPKTLIPDIEEAIARNVLVIITSRTYTGRVLPEYGYEGGGKHLESIGCILAGDMKGVKARLKLMTLFGKYQDADIVKRFFKQSLL